MYLDLQCSNYRESFQYYKIFQIFKNFKCAQNMFFETFQLFGDEKKKNHFLENNCLDLGHCIARLILIIWRHVVLYYWHLPIHESIVIETCQSSFLKSEKKKCLAWIDIWRSIESTCFSILLQSCATNVTHFEKNTISCLVSYKCSQLCKYDGFPKSVK